MNNEEEFKRKLRDLLNEQNYEYDAANWEVAKQTLDEEDSKRRGFWFFILTGAGLGLAFLTYLLWPVGEIKQHRQIEKKENRTSLRRKNVEQNSVKQNNESEKIKESETENNTAIKNNLPGQKEPTGGANLQNEKENPWQSTIPVSNSNATNQMQNKTVITQRSSYTKSTTQSIHFSSSSKSFKTHEGHASNKNTSFYSEQHSLSQTTSTKSEEHTYLSPEVSSKQPDDISKQESRLPQETNSTIDPKNSTDSTNKTQVSEIRGIATHSSSPAKSPEKEKKTSSHSFTVNPQKADYFYVQAGSYYNLGWKYNGIREAMGFNPSFGFGYLTGGGADSKMAFSIGASYASINNLKLNNKTVKATQNDFVLRNSNNTQPALIAEGTQLYYGPASDVTSITPINLHYLVLPLHLHYNLNKRQAAFIGVVANYLLEVRSQVETYTEISGTKENKKLNKTGGYTEGFNTYNFQLSLGYRFKLYKRFWLNSELMYGINDLRDNHFFGINLKEQMSGIKIGLTYNISKNEKNELLHTHAGFTYLFCL